MNILWVIYIACCGSNKLYSSVVASCSFFSLTRAEGYNVREREREKECLLWVIYIASDYDDASSLDRMSMFL